MAKMTTRSVTEIVRSLSVSATIRPEKRYKDIPALLFHCQLFVASWFDPSDLLEVDARENSESCWTERSHFRKDEALIGRDLSREAS